MPGVVRRRSQAASSRPVSRAISNARRNRPGSAGSATAISRRAASRSPRSSAASTRVRNRLPGRLSGLLAGASRSASNTNRNASCTAGSVVLGKVFTRPITSSRVAVLQSVRGRPLRADVRTPKPSMLAPSNGATVISSGRAPPPVTGSSPEVGSSMLFVSQSMAERGVSCARIGVAPTARHSAVTLRQVRRRGWRRTGLIQLQLDGLRQLFNLW